eukprot:6056870-Pyramimonas_sp.AAC.1
MIAAGPICLFLRRSPLAQARVPRIMCDSAWANCRIKRIRFSLGCVPRKLEMPQRSKGRSSHKQRGAKPERERIVFWNDQTDRQTP